MVPFLFQRDKNGFNGKMLFHITADARRPRQQNVSIFREIVISDEWNSAPTEMKRKAEHLHKSHIENAFCCLKSSLVGHH